ncbi:MAG: hypothetical protein Q8K05_09415 [Polaromonas sp.]|jgi:hypothetical protein|uniref:hypothetical protein n=1 Tax=Polaromonas sp. TaxID=1869339 RepID=UPI0027321704|nr:hypothetical protein [Polaromonas sp.]MDP2256257.1 hypothetical protein [Polaromonas sp.]
MKKTVRSFSVFILEPFHEFENARRGGPGAETGHDASLLSSNTPPLGTGFFI